MDPTAAAQALFHTLNTHIRTNVNRTVSFVHSGQLETRPNPFRPSEPLVLEVVPGAKRLENRLKELGVNNDPELAEALRATIAEHMHFVLSSLFSALDGEGAIYAEDDTEVQLQLRILNGEPLPGYLHEIFKPAKLS